jgi:hypothetical protein
MCTVDEPAMLLVVLGAFGAGVAVGAFVALSALATFGALDALALDAFWAMDTFAAMDALGVFVARAPLAAAPGEAGAGRAATAT